MPTIMFLPPVSGPLTPVISVITPVRRSLDVDLSHDFLLSVIQIGSKYGVIVAATIFLTPGQGTQSRCHKPTQKPT